jgi:hypothetical protein
MKLPLRIALGLAAAVALLLLPRLRQPAPSTPAAPAAPAPAVSFAAELAAGLTFPSTPSPRPLPVARSSAHHQWPAGDTLTPDAIQLIARNADEFIRLVEENDRILRRQLVYRQDVAAAAVQRSRFTGEPVRTLILPGLDGEEYEITVTRADLSPSGQSGTFSGRLANQPDSLVTLAFQFGREAFTILSTSAGLFLQGHPRESGEIIVTRFEPEAYSPQPGGEPILTHQD